MTSLVIDLECVGIDTAADYLEPVEAPDNYKKPEAIEKYIAEATAKQVDRAGLDPDLCRIVALGVEETVTICRTEADERIALRAFWAQAQPEVHRVDDLPRLISFNGFGYDLPVLMRRSQYLGVPFQPLSVDRYRSPHIDLMQRLTFNGAIKAHRLSFYASRFGIVVEDAIDGSQIAALVKAGDWAGVESHCRSDVRLTRALAQKLGLLPKGA